MSANGNIFIGYPAGASVTVPSTERSAVIWVLDNIQVYVGRVVTLSNIFDRNHTDTFPVGSYLIFVLDP